MRTHKEVEMKAAHKFSSLVTIVFVQLLFDRGIRINFFKVLSFPVVLNDNVEHCVDFHLS